MIFESVTGLCAALVEVVVVNDPSKKHLQVEQVLLESTNKMICEQNLENIAVGYDVDTTDW